MSRMYKRLTKYFRYGEKGFTLIELLVVVAILGVLAAVAVPQVGKFINRGKTESWATELHNIQTGVMALLVESDAGLLDDADADGWAVLGETDMDNVSVDGNADILSNYVIGLDANNEVKTGCDYDIDIYGKVVQHTP